MGLSDFWKSLSTTPSGIYCRYTDLIKNLVKNNTISLNKNIDTSIKLATIPENVAPIGVSPTDENNYTLKNIFMPIGDVDVYLVYNSSSEKPSTGNSIVNAFNYAKNYGGLRRWSPDATEDMLEVYRGTGANWSFIPSFLVNGVIMRIMAVYYTGTETDFENDTYISSNYSFSTSTLDEYFQNHSDKKLLSVYGQVCLNTQISRNSSISTNYGLAIMSRYRVNYPIVDNNIQEIVTLPYGGPLQLPICGLASVYLNNTSVYRTTSSSFIDSAYMGRCGTSKIIISDTTRQNPEASYCKCISVCTATKEQIIEYATKYGLIVCTSNATNTLDNSMYTPKENGKGGFSGYTNGNKNSTNPRYDRNGYDAYDNNTITKDPNSYTNKIDLNKPTLTTTGIFNRTFALTATSIKSLSDFLWNADETIFNEIVKGLSLMGANPIDGLIDLRLYPFNVVNKTSGGGSKSIVVGRTDTKVNGIEINDYNAILDLGGCTFFPYFGNFLDYEPFTTASLYIPYVGIVPISTADFMGQTISCKMVVDITTGSCTAIVFANDIPIIYKNGNIGVEIPMTGTNSAEYASRIMGGLTSGAADVALGAASKSVGQVVSGVGSIVDSALSVNNTMYNTAGSSSPACGLWQPQNCYFIIQRPVPIVPENYGHTVGYACNYQAKISECSGYTQTYNVDVSSINAPEFEKNAIAGILNSGFYA